MFKKRGKNPNKTQIAQNQGFNFADSDDEDAAPLNEDLTQFEEVVSPDAIRNLTHVKILVKRLREEDSKSKKRHETKLSSIQVIPSNS